MLNMGEILVFLCRNSSFLGHSVGLEFCFSTAVHRHSLTIDHGRLESPSRDLVLKHDVDLTKSTTHGLGQSEIAVNDQTYVDGNKDETAFSAESPSPGFGSEESWEKLLQSRLR